MDSKYAPMPPPKLSPNANARQAWQDGYHEAARKYADPLDGLWWCETHGYRIDRFEGVTPEHCLYEGRPGDCKPIAALIVRGITEAPDGQ